MSEKKCIKKRGNGQGTAYQRNGSWEAQIIVGWRVPDDPKKRPIPIKKRKSGFKTKKEALAYCSTTLKLDTTVRKIKLSKVYEEWEKKYCERVSEKTMEGYKQAFQHFLPLHPVNIDLITAADLQKCMDDCTKGKRTHEMMKTTINLLFKYAVDARYVLRNVAENLYTGKGRSVQREAITDDELKLIKNAVGKEPYADYVYALCYLGFRPSEFLALKKTDYHEKDDISYLVGGSKTEAGINRRVVIPAQILDIVKERLKVEGTDLLFPMLCYSRDHKKMYGYKLMTHNYFNNFVFQPLAAKLGIVGKVPYSARHTYSDKLKHASGDGKDKAALIGHTDYDFTQHRYQSTSLQDLAAVVETIE